MNFSVTEAEFGPVMQDAISISKQATFCNNDRYPITHRNYIYLRRLLLGCIKDYFFSLNSRWLNLDPLSSIRGSRMSTISALINRMLLNPVSSQSHKLFWPFWSDINYSASQFTLTHFILDSICLL